MEEFRKVHQYNVFCVSHPMQAAVEEFIGNRNHYLELSSFYEAKRNLFLELIAGSKFKAVPSAGTYFQNLDFSAISDEKDTDFAIRLTKEHKIASIPLSVFYKDRNDFQRLRFCFAKSDDTLKKAADILCKI
jgi:methionine aminotransferase